MNYMMGMEKAMCLDMSRWASSSKLAVTHPTETLGRIGDFFEASKGI